MSKLTIRAFRGIGFIKLAENKPVFIRIKYFISDINGIAI